MYTIATPTAPVTFEQSQHDFSPKTPSPLRTSRNANLMPPPLPPPPPQWSSSPPLLDTKSSPLAHYAPVQQAFSLTPRPQPRRASTPSIFAISSTSTSTTSMSTNANVTTSSATFASRSRASTPTATLSAHAAAAKDRRRTLFRDRIRKQRDDARAPATAVAEELDGDGRMEGMDGLGGEADGIVPLTEEEEIEALAQYLLEREDEDEDEDEEMRLRENGDERRGWEEQWQRRRLSDHEGFRSGGSGSYGSDEEDYDQLFMEVISGSQEQGGPGRWPVQQQQWGQDSGLDADQGQLSSSMDLS
ncbi:hypothetical protein EPUS_04584 [Endocarpon pusillum Z07020]|uniref:Uncharacterized protein n=1 Tax=Endocarpon pusillum (strain Z07020 / HMAS-L-300199) TaxID=1263415 RepID=U1I138_ENDPU|nr:uncharacterized protein EPUS_04584 [Endocarpon pusillum Z07020]ERF75604.1 hypothetical protein EPUS_04584 [Endocarpon pusillum Z07020]